MTNEKELAVRACAVIFENEGGYYSVNPDDNGAVSVGRLQWHGTRALRLLKKIISALGRESAIVHLGESLYREISEARSWQGRSVGAYEKAQLEAVLGTPESRAVQDAQAEADVCSYISHIRSLGVCEDNAVIFMADIENQGGAGACKRIILAADGSDIDSLYRSAECDRVFCDRMKRRARVYMKLTGRVYGEGESVLLHEIRRGETLSAIAREYGCTVSAICRENSIKNPDRISAGDILRIPRAEQQPPKEQEQEEGAKTVYTVVKGDTLTKIASKLSLDYREIARINGIEPPYLIYPGQELSLCCEDEERGRVHKVVRGDTLYAISRLWGVSISDIVAHNKEKYKNISPSYIVAGWELAIPLEGER